MTGPHTPTMLDLVLGERARATARAERLAQLYPDRHLARSPGFQAPVEWLRRAALALASPRAEPPCCPQAA